MPLCLPVVHVRGLLSNMIQAQEYHVSLIVTFHTSPVVRSAVLQYSRIRGTFANVLDVVDKTSDFSKFVLPLADGDC